MAIFEIAKNGIWSKSILVKLIYLISRIFVGLDFFKFSGLLWVCQCPITQVLFVSDQTIYRNGNEQPSVYILWGNLRMMHQHQKMPLLQSHRYRRLVQLYKALYGHTGTLYSKIPVKISPVKLYVANSHTTLQGFFMCAYL